MADDFIAALANPGAHTALDLNSSSVGAPIVGHAYVTDGVAEALEALRQFTALESLKITAIPVTAGLIDAILEIPNLRHLVLWGCELKALPDRIRQLRHLETLVLNSNPLVVLPDAIGELRDLRVLSLVGCEHLVALPVSVLQLQKLESLALHGNYSLTELPPGLLAYSARLDSTSRDGIQKRMAKANDATRAAARCSVELDGQRHAAVLLDWPNGDESVVDYLTDELMDEMSEHADLVPFAILGPPGMTVAARAEAAFLQEIGQPAEILLLRQSDEQVYRCGYGLLGFTRDELAVS